MIQQTAEWGAEVRRWLRPSYVWRRFIHNLVPKLLALVAALLLWYVTTADRRAQVDQVFDVPITVRDNSNTDGQRAVSDLKPDTIKVTLQGRPERLKELRGANIEAVVDVTGLPEGSFNRPAVVTAPRDTTLTGATTRIQGFVDSQLSRTLPVTISVATPPENSLPRYSVSPAETKVSGASRVVSTVDRVTTTPTSLAPGEEREVHLIALDAQGVPIDGVQANPTTVTIRRLDTGEVPVKALRVVLNDPPKTLKVTASSVQPSSVRVVAAPELLARLREVTGTVTYREGTYSVPVQLKVPPGAQVLEAVNVSLTVEKVTAP